MHRRGCSSSLSSSRVATRFVTSTCHALSMVSVPCPQVREEALHFKERPQCIITALEQRLRDSKNIPPDNIAPWQGSHTLVLKSEKAQQDDIRGLIREGRLPKGGLDCADCAERAVAAAVCVVSMVLRVCCGFGLPQEWPPSGQWLPVSAV